MTDITRTVLIAGLLAFSGPALAQEDGTAGEEQVADPAEGLDMGQEAGGEDGVGQIYVRETHGDWEVRCVRSEQESDPCQIHQTLMGPQGNAVSEVSMFPLPEGGQAIAGATIAVPLMTLLTEQLSIAVDDGTAKRYSYSWCDQEGCYARVGFTEADIAAFKAGAGATMKLVPVAAPDQTVDVSMSLSGFTAAYDALAQN